MIHATRRHRRAGAASGIILALAVAPVEAAPPQRWSLQYEGDYWVYRDTGMMTREHLPALLLLLELDAEQRDAARLLFDGVRDQFLAASERHTRYQRALNRDKAPEAFRPDEEARSEFCAHAAALRDQFLADLRELLTPAQLDRWPRVERQLERVSDLAALRDTERGDPVSLAALALGDDSASPDAMTLLDRYVGDSHRLLRQAQAETEDARQRLRERGIARATADTRAEIDAEMAPARRTLIEHQRLSIEMIDRLAPMLPERSRAQFLRDAYRRALLEGTNFAHASGSTEDQMIDWVFAQPDVTPEQRDAVAAAALAQTAEFARTIRPIVIAGLDTRERALKGEPAAPANGNPWAHMEALQSMRDGFAASIRAHLTPEQIARAPRPLNNTLPPVPVFADLPQTEVTVASPAP